MSFFDKIFSREKKISLGDASASSKGMKAYIVKKLGLAFVDSIGAAAKKDFQEPDFDLEEITKAYNTDSYIRQAIDKYVDLIFKSGWDVTGKNQKAVDYVNLRLMAIAEATQMNTRHFLIELAEDLVKYSNVFLVKARASGSYTFPPGITVSTTDTKPVAGYFILPPSTMKIAREENGTIANYQQEVSGKTPIEFKPEDIIHIAWKKERGQAFGVSFITPVLEDVLILRQIEEDVIRLIYRNLFPLYTYTVGIDKPGYEATDEEIEVVRDTIREMPTDGGVVLPERHKIEVVGSQGKALEVNEYLQYFRSRVFSGLGVSDSLMGIGSTVNRATAESMSGEMRDRIKAFQRVIEDALNFSIFNELLREGGFDPLLKPEDKVFFTFREIDLDSRTKMEQSVSQLWLNDLITFEEARQMVGYEPVVDEARLHSRFVTGFNAEQQAQLSAQHTTNEPASSNKTTKKQAAMKESLEVLNPRLNAVISENTQKLRYHWELTRLDVVELVKAYYLTKKRDFLSYEHKEVANIINLTIDSIANLSEQYIRSSFIYGVDSARNQIGSSQVPNLKYNGYTKEVNDIYMKRIRALLEEDLGYLIKVIMRNASYEDVIAKITGAFASLEFRLNFIADYELKKAYYYGFIRCAEWFGYQEVSVDTTEDCAKCKNNNAVINIQTASLYTSIPPFHPSCNCSLRLDRKGDE
jgi:hypothetical protein